MCLTVYTYPYLYSDLSNQSESIWLKLELIFNFETPVSLSWLSSAWNSRSTVSELVEVYAIPRQVHARLHLAHLRPIVHRRQVRLVKTPCTVSDRPFMYCGPPKFWATDRLSMYIYIYIYIYIYTVYIYILNLPIRDSSFSNSLGAREVVGDSGDIFYQINLNVRLNFWFG